MKILLLADRMESGGAETHIEQLALGLLARGHTVALLSSGGGIADRLARVGVKQYRTPSVSLLPWRWLAARRMLVRLVRKEGFEILHAHTRRRATLLSGCEAWNATGVLTLHAKFRTRRYHRWAMPRCGGTVAVSEDLRIYAAEECGIPIERVEVIRNGIDTEFFSPPPGSAERRGVLFVSRMDGDCARGAELLCRIAPELYSAHRELTLTLVGGGDALCRIRCLAEEANRRVGREIVRTTGALEREELLPLLQNAAIFVGVSRAAMEAASCGCAVILCGNEGYLGILSPENSALAEASNFCGRGEAAPDVARLAVDLSRLLSSPEKLQKAGEFARKTVRERFSAEEMCAATERLYRSLLPRESDASLLIGGYAGCGNLGDDAILGGILRVCAEDYPSLRVTALTAAAGRNSRRFGIPCISRRNLLSVASRMASSEAFLSGGGTLLQNETANRSLWYYLFLIRLAKRFGCRTALVASGLGELNGTWAERAVRRTLTEVDRFSMREEVSARRLLQMGLPPERISVGADAAFLLQMPPKARAQAILRELRLPRDARLLLVALRPMQDGRILRVILTAVRHLAARYGFSPLFVAFDTQEDARITARGAAHCGARVFRPREVSDLLAILSVSELSIVMRLHGMILSTVAGIPSVGIPAEGKLRIFAPRLGQTAIVREELTVAALVETVLSEWRARENLRVRLLQIAEEEAKKARKDLAKTLGLVYNGR